MNKAQGYFGAEAGDSNLYARPIPKCNLQCQSFANTVTHTSMHRLGYLLKLFVFERDNF